MKNSYLPLVVALSMSTSGCWFGNQAKVKVPTAPSAAPGTAPSAPQASLPSEGAAAEAVPAAAPAPSTEASGSPALAPGPSPATNPTPKPPVARANPTPGPPATPPGPPGPTSAGPAAGSMPQLAEILTGDQRRQYQAEYTQDVVRSNTALKQAGGHSLSAAQRETVARIRTFLNQAEAARYNDLATAVQLSRRANLLAQELLKGLK
jgi:hypothetical protein